MRAVLLICFAVTTLVPFAYADGRDYARQSVALFDELVVCSSKPTFNTYGLSRAGPCGNWVDRVEALQEKDTEIVRAGFFCLAGDVRMAGNSKAFGDREHFNFVRDSVEECRKGLR